MERISIVETIFQKQIYIKIKIMSRLSLHTNYYVVYIAQTYVLPTFKRVEEKIIKNRFTKI